MILQVDADATLRLHDVDIITIIKRYKRAITLRRLRAVSMRYIQVGAVIVLLMIVGLKPGAILLPVAFSLLIARARVIFIDKPLSGR